MGADSQGPLPEVDFREWILFENRLLFLPLCLFKVIKHILHVVVHFADEPKQVFSYAGESEVV